MIMVKDPVCGMEISEDLAAAKELYQGTTLFFCSESCHGKFQADPARYVKPETVKDPVCGMDISKDTIHHVEHAGKSYYFCSDSCLGKFEANPGSYL